MAGHNKWSQIKHKKAKEDAKRGQAFTKLSKEITVAAKDGGGDPAGNARLRSLLEKAREINMPAENTSRAIKRGTGELPGVSYTPLTYEGHGPKGIAVIIETLSDNKNRTVADLRHLCSSKGGNLGETGSVSWMFDYKGVVRGTSDTLTEDDLLEALIEYNVDDIAHEDNEFSIYCDPKSLDIVKTTAQKAGLTVNNAELEWVAKNTVALSNEENEQAVEFLSALQDHDDVQNVYTNLA